ncbi:hypothetical protein WDA79_13130 [Streptomyces sp. A475]|uniref:hypothetical protein n=1 Tax=Streptomyces sp. A475 TaxID=3131976 RepID=UPI0030C93D5E
MHDEDVAYEDECEAHRDATATKTDQDCGHLPCQALYRPILRESRIQDSDPLRNI